MHEQQWLSQVFVSPFLACVGFGPREYLGNSACEEWERGSILSDISNVITE